MYFSKKTKLAYHFYVCSFVAFSFLSAIFCNFTRVNNIFHIAALFYLFSLISQPKLQVILLKKNTVTGLLLVVCFLSYYTVSNAWGDMPDNITSTAKHAIYILIYLAMLITILTSAQRNLLLIAVITGILLLCIYLIGFDYHEIHVLRKTTDINPGPSNVIDISGYAAIGIILSLIVSRDTQQKKVLLVIPLFFTFMVLTQSRGPLLALSAVLILTTSYKNLNRIQLIGVVVMVVFAILTVMFSNAGEMLFSRFETLYQQSFVRISIWCHSLSLVEQMPFFGYGFTKELNFTNYTGESIHTTHSLYFGALLKGGWVGFCLFFGLLAFGATLAIRHYHAGQRLESALYLFMLIFYASQGMFVIANPSEFWYLFWFPLAIVLTQPGRTISNRTHFSTATFF